LDIGSDMYRSIGIRLIISERDRSTRPPALPVGNIPGTTAQKLEPTPLRRFPDDLKS
jgi:hypothetical protein